MGIFDRFPYSSTHEMNLDFMLGKATEIAESLQEIDTHKEQAEQAAQAAQAAQTAAQAAQTAARAAQTAAGTSASQAAQHKADAEDAADRAEAASDLADAAVEQAQTAAQNASTAATNASTAADGAIASAATAETRINTLAASLPEDFTELNNEVTYLKSALKNDGSLDIFPFLNTVGSESGYNGITITKNDNGSFTLNGTATGLVNFVFFYIDIDHEYIKKGDTLVFEYTGDRDNQIPLEIWWTPSGGSLTKLTAIWSDQSYKYEIPSNISKLYVRFSIVSGSVISNKTVKVSIYKETAVPIKSNMKWVPSGTDILSITATGVYGLVSDVNYVNNIIENTQAGYMIVYQVGTIIIQHAFEMHGYYMYSRVLFNGTWSSVAKLKTVDSQTVNGKGLIASGTDFNNIVEAGVYMIGDDNYTYANRPFNGAGTLVVYRSEGNQVIVQMAIPWDPTFIMLRRSHLAQGTFSAWRKSGGEMNVTNEYTFNEYQNSITNNVSPTITTDTHNYLESTGDTTDVSAAIEAMLATGECHLGPGNFYVSGIDMPDNSVLYGCGDSTVINLLKGANDKYAIRMGWYNTIHSLKITGNDETTSTVGDRHGILVQGNYTETENSYSHDMPRSGRIYDVHIVSFNGGGITCYDTGYATFNNLNATNCLIEACAVGINISYWSEFHKFTNIQCRGCWYGCINNGGNNVFVNCDFSENKLIAFLIDNSSDQSPNNAHGSVIGCVFNHTANNAGTGIKVINTHNGFVFDGCQIFYSKIELIDSYGIEIVNTNFGQQNCDIIIDGGGLALFANNMHQAAPTITVTGNTNVHFKDCYVRQTGAIVEP